MDLKEKVFEYFSMNFYGSNQRPPGPGYPRYWNLYLLKLGKGLQGKATYQNFKHLEQQVLKKKEFDFLLCILQFKPRTPGKRPSWFLGQCLKTLGKGQVRKST